MADSPLPQRGTHSDAIVSSVNWLFDPYWPGDRLIVRLDRGSVTVTDSAGQPAGPQIAQAGPLVAAAIDAQEAVVDGIWTGQPFIGIGIGDGDGNGNGDVGRRAFVAIDLLEIDGTPLYDLPLQERRRLLVSAVTEDVRVRVSPAVKWPIESWLATWRANGFERYVAKHVNSRYRPGEQVEDWLVIDIAHERPLALVRRIFSQRRRKLRRISD